MAFKMFEQPIYVQRKHYIEEITGLDDVFDFLANGRKAGATSSMR